MVTREFLDFVDRILGSFGYNRTCKLGIESKLDQSPCLKNAGCLQEECQCIEPLGRSYDNDIQKSASCQGVWRLDYCLG